MISRPPASSPATRCTDGEQVKTSQVKTRQVKTSQAFLVERHATIVSTYHTCIISAPRASGLTSRLDGRGLPESAPPPVVGTPLSTSDSSVYTRFKACFRTQVMPRARGTAQPSKKLPKISQSDAEGTRDGHHAVDNS